MKGTKICLHDFLRFSSFDEHCEPQKSIYFCGSAGYAQVIKRSRMMSAAARIRERNVYQALRKKVFIFAALPDTHK